VEFIASSYPDPLRAGEVPAARALLRAGESVLFIDSKEREYLRTLRPGTRMHIRSGFIAADEVIGTPEGRQVENSGRETFLVLRPTYASLIPNLPRRAQVIYPKDVGTILLWGDIAPGVRVIEVGTGPGALSMALLRAVGPTGELTDLSQGGELATDTPDLRARDLDGDGTAEVLGVVNDYQPDYAGGTRYWMVWSWRGGRYVLTGCRKVQRGEREPSGSLAPSGCPS